MSCGCNGAITNQGARLIDRARNEGKSIVFSGVRMNTVYENDLMSLVQKPETWFGENVGQVVGCLSHILIGDVSHVCDAKVAVQCNDNSKAWKTIGVYGHLEGESNDTLIYCESIQNGDFKGTTVVELPVTLDGAVDDFGLSEGSGGGEGGGGDGGGDVPAKIRAGQGIVQDAGDGYLEIFGEPIPIGFPIARDYVFFTFDNSGYFESVCVDDTLIGRSEVATIGVIVRDENGNMVANGRVSGFSMGVKTPLTFQSPIQLLKGYTITYQAIFSDISG